MRTRMTVWVVAVVATGTACTSGSSTGTTSGPTPAVTVPSTSVIASTTVPASSTTAGADAAVLEWSRVPHSEAVFGGLALQAMTGVAVVDGLVVAVGTDWSGGDADAAVWTSSDGVTWSKVSQDESVFGGEGWQTINWVRRL